MGFGCEPEPGTTDNGSYEQPCVINTDAAGGVSCECG